MAKNIVVCCDGTGNELGEQKSNVIKLYETLIRNATQIAYYHPGVGTMGSRNALSPIGKWWTRLIGLAFGYGISDNIADAYEFLMRNFEPDDSVYVFGFSRGAYTARALCGMLHIVGLLTEGNEGLIPYAIRMIKQKEINFPVAAEFKETFSRECKPHFVGVWDTVSSLGWIYNAVHFFRENSFGAPNNAQQDIKEVWFAGVHSDVGGSYAESESQLSQIALRWMLREGELAGLLVDQGRKAAILGAKPPNVSPDPTTKYQHESLRGAWWIAELWPKIVHIQTTQGEWHKTIRFNLGRRRWISPGSSVHESVEQRLQKAHPPYRPSNLPEERAVIRDRCEN